MNPNSIICNLVVVITNMKTCSLDGNIVMIPNSYICGWVACDFGGNGGGEKSHGDYDAGELQGFDLLLVGDSNYKMIVDVDSKAISWMLSCTVNIVKHSDFAEAL